MKKSLTKHKTENPNNADLNSWLFQFNELKKYKKKFKTTCILRNNKEYKSLYKWCNEQKELFETKLIHEKHKTKLDQIDFFWGSTENEIRHQLIWDGHFEDLKKYFKKNETIIVAVKGNKELKKIADWVVYQRMFYNKGKLSEYRIKKLNSINFIWKLKDTSRASDEEKWLSKLAELASYKEKFGLCNVPQTNTEYKKLGRWLNDQRVAYKTKKLSQSRFESLEKLGVVWDMDVYYFELHIKDLMRYKKRYGNFKVPVNYEENMTLGNFVYRLNTGGMPIQWKKDRLLEIGFEDFNILEKKEETWVTKNWFKMLRKLEYLHKKGIDVNIERNYAPNPKLGDWVYNQKRSFIKNKLKDIQIIKLKKIGLNFDKKNQTLNWNDVFQIVAMYKKNNGTTNIPEDFDKIIHAWVTEQKKAFKEKTLTPDRLNKLNTIEFEW